MIEKAWYIRYSEFHVVAFIRLNSYTYFLNINNKKKKILKYKIQNTKYNYKHQSILKPYWSFYDGRTPYRLMRQDIIQSSTINTAGTSEINLKKNFKNFIKWSYFYPINSLLSNALKKNGYNVSLKYTPTENQDENNQQRE